MPMRAGEKQGKPLLGSDEPSLWYEAAAALAQLKTDGPPLSPEQLEERRSAAEAALEREATAFENAIGEQPLMPHAAHVHRNPRETCHVPR